MASASMDRSGSSTRFKWARWLFGALTFASILVLIVALFNAFVFGWMWRSSNPTLKLWAARIVLADRSLIGANKNSVRALLGIPKVTTGPKGFLTLPSKDYLGPYLRVDLNPDHSIRDLAGFHPYGFQPLFKVTPFDASKWEHADTYDRRFMTWYLVSQWHEGKLNWKTYADAKAVLPVNEFVDTWEYSIDPRSDLSISFNEEGFVSEVKQVSPFDYLLGPFDDSISGTWSSRSTTP